MAKKKHKTEILNVKVSPREKRLWESAADVRECSLSEWVRTTLNRAAEELVDSKGRGLRVTDLPDGTTKIELVQTGNCDAPDA